MSPEPRPALHHDFESVIGWIRSLRTQHFEGEIHLVMHRQQIVKVSKHETLKADAPLRAR